MVLMAAVVFGLSTDYEVFLLSRMVEARGPRRVHDGGGDHRAGPDRAGDQRGGAAADRRDRGVRAVQR